MFAEYFRLLPGQQLNWGQCRHAVACSNNRLHCASRLATSSRWSLELGRLHHWDLRYLVEAPDIPQRQWQAVRSLLRHYQLWQRGNFTIVRAGGCTQTFLLQSISACCLASNLTGGSADTL